MKFRKKPVEIEAHQWDGNWKSIPEWLRTEWKVGGVFCAGPKLVIHTLEGDMVAMPGDWIIQGVKGELYPCKDEIFRQTYEQVEAEHECIYEQALCTICGRPDHDGIA